MPEGSSFSLANLPYGVGGRPGEPARILVAAGAHALDLAATSDLGLLAGVLPAEVARATTLNPLMAMGAQTWTALRARLQELVSDSAATGRLGPALLPLGEVALQLPF